MVEPFEEQVSERFVLCRPGVDAEGSPSNGVS
jgi:hypothetical protein